jgi:hypothetical protein
MQTLPRLMTVLTLSLITLVANSASAADNEAGSTKPLVARGRIIVQGENELGFTLAEGKSVKTTVKDTTYEFTLERVTPKSAVLKLTDTTKGVTLDRVTLTPGGKPQASLTAPFAFTLSEVDTMADSSCGAKSGDGVGTLGACCIECGGAIYCCNSSPGECCQLECWALQSSCASCG